MVALLDIFGTKSPDDIPLDLPESGQSRQAWLTSKATKVVNTIWNFFPNSQLTNAADTFNQRKFCMCKKGSDAIRDNLIVCLMQSYMQRTIDFMTFQKYNSIYLNDYYQRFPSICLWAFMLEIRYN